MEDTKSFNRERLAGNTSNQTAVAVSQEGWLGGASAVVLAKDSDFPDALAGAPLPELKYSGVLWIKLFNSIQD